MGIRAVVLDIGETVLDRTREYASWADFFGVPAHSFSAVFGAMIADGATVAQVIESFGDGRGFAELAAERGTTVTIEERDLYPDVRAAIADLTTAGLTVGIVGNQPSSTSEQLEALDLGADFVASSTTWGVAKPSAEFFAAVCAAAGAAPAEIVYVGDQLGNDVVAPTDAGLAAIRILRGPWGYLTSDPAVEARCLAVIHSLAELGEILGRRRADA